MSDFITMSGETSVLHLICHGYYINMSWGFISSVTRVISHKSRVYISSVTEVSLSCQGAMYHFLGDFYLICRGIQISLVMWFISHLSWKSYIICGGDFISPVIGFISHLTWRVISYLWLEWYLTCHWYNFSSVIGVVCHMSWGLSWGLHLICYECYVSNLSWRYISSFVEFWGGRERDGYAMLVIRLSAV